MASEKKNRDALREAKRELDELDERRVQLRATISRLRMLVDRPECPRCREWGLVGR